MNKEQYMNELNKNLSALPKQDKEDALAYYDEYLSDLTENDPEKISALDDPAVVAAQIKADSAMKGTKNTSVKEKKGISAAWAVLLGVLALPIGLPVAIAIAAVALALIITGLAVVISLFAGALSLGITGIIALVSGPAVLFTEPSTGFFYLGFGLFSLAAGYAASVGVFILSKKMFAGIAKLINNIRIKIQTKRTNNSEVK